jgi:DNA primase
LSQLGITGTKGNRKAQVLGIDRELDLSNPQLPEHILGTYEFCPTNLLDSGFHKDTLRHFDIGFDLMNARITYPLRDHLGRLVGISGRTVVGAPIRYKIYKREVGIPKYAIHKQRILWNYDTLAVASNMGHPPDSVILLEGFKAVMWLYQHGWPGGVCGLGTAVSDEQVELLARLTDTLFVFFDNDLPGISATHRASKKLKKYFRLRFANYPEENGVGLSPDDLTKEQLDRATINYLSTSQWMARYQPILRTIRENKRRERTKQRYA